VTAKLALTTAGVVLSLVVLSPNARDARWGIREVSACSAAATRMDLVARAL
jgi:hypothetical protein